MGLIYANIKDQESLGATLGTTRDDLNIDFTAHIIRDDYFAYAEEGCASTIQDLIDKVTSVQLSTVTGQPESTIDADDLFETIPYLNMMRYWSLLTAADNTPHAFSLAYPLSPFPKDPTRNFGAPPGKLIQWVINSIADVDEDYDGYVHDLTLEGVSRDLKPSPRGYMRTTQDAYTSQAVGEIRDTKIAAAKRLLAVKNFQTTSFDDLAAAAAFNVTGIREQAIAFSDDIKFGPYKPSRTWSMENFGRAIISTTAGAAESWGETLDRGHFLSDFGWNNAASELGIDTSRAEIKIKTTAGVAEATRVQPWSLV